MRKVVLSIAISLDGYIAKPNGNVEWLKSVPNPEKTDHGFGDFYKTIDTTIMGNNTYKEILGFGIPFPFPDKKNYVITRSPQPDTEFISFVSDIIPIVKKLKEDNGKNIWLIGGGQINTILLNRNLIDELLIRIVPIVIGEGIPLFTQKAKQTIFELLKTETFSSGIVQMTYRPIFHDKKVEIE
jgi:dihydrofolate reductase